MLGYLPPYVVGTGLTRASAVWLLCGYCVAAEHRWLNVFADLLLGIGFVLIAMLGSSRAAVIIDHKTKLVGAWTGAMLLFAFFFGLLQAMTESRLMGGIMAGLNVVVALFLIPTFFVLLGIGLGRVSSIQTLNDDLSEAVAEVGENTADDYKGTDQEVVEAVEQANSTSKENPVLSSADD